MRWGPAEGLREKQRIQRNIGRPPVKTELWVRTVDQFEEAKDVFGGIESLVQAEGVDVYSVPLQRSPTKVRDRSAVKAQILSDWVAGAEEELRIAKTSSYGGAQSAVRSLERSIMAACILFNIRSTPKDEPIGALIEKIRLIDPITGQRLGDAMKNERDTVKAEAVLAALVRRARTGRQR